jgi:hypothetical protein
MHGFASADACLDLPACRPPCRPYYERQEDMVARAALAALAPPDSSTTSIIINNFGNSSGSSTEHTDEPSSLDPSRPEDLLRAIRAINSVVLEDEGLADNAAGPYDPLNGSIADVMNSKSGALPAGLQELLIPSHVPCSYLLC